MSSKRHVIAVDFDDTIRCAKTGKPIEKVIKFMRDEIDKFNFVVVYTARLQEDRGFVECWLKEHNVCYDLLELGKLRFDVLIDDKALHPNECAKWS